MTDRKNNKIYAGDYIWFHPRNLSFDLDRDSSDAEFFEHKPIGGKVYDTDEDLIDPVATIKFKELGILYDGWRRNSFEILKMTPNELFIYMLENGEIL